MGQVGDLGDNRIVGGRRHGQPLHFGANQERLQARLLGGGSVQRDLEVKGVLKEVGPTGGNPAFVRPRHRVSPDKGDFLVHQGGRGG